VVVGELLVQRVPELASGELEIVAIARAVGELSKVAVRQRLRIQPATARPVLLVLGRAGERIRPVREALGHERVVQWHAEPLRYIADTPGLSYLPSAVLYPGRRRADVLLSVLSDTENKVFDAKHWRNRLSRRPCPPCLQHAAGVGADLMAGERQADRPHPQLAHAHGEALLTEQRPVPAAAVGKAAKGVRPRVYGLNGLLPSGRIRG
jgi:hypothetical protein